MVRESASAICPSDNRAEPTQFGGESLADGFDLDCE
jgi:hypothetical protein